MKLPGYEFTDKKIRKQFNKTEYGKKCSKYLYASIALFIAAAAITFEGMLLICFNSKCSNTFDLFIRDYGCYYSGLMIVLGVIMCYLDGKRDGAIRQFEIDMKNKKEKK